MDTLTQITDFAQHLIETDAFRKGCSDWAKENGVTANDWNSDTKLRNMIYFNFAMKAAADKILSN